LTLEQGATNNGFLLAAVQTKNNGEGNEVNEAIDYALAKYPQINPKKVYLTGLSNGGGVVNKYLAENKDAHLKIAAAAPMCAGWNKYFFAAQLTDQFAHTKVPIWAFHCADDEVLSPIESTYPNIKMIQAAGGKAVMTIHNTGRHGGGWQAYGYNKPGQIPATPATATEFNNPGYNLFDWFDANEIGKPAVMPRKFGEKPPVVIPPVINPGPPPVIPPITEPLPPTVDKTVTIHASFTNIHEKGNKTQWWWTDDEPIDLTLETFLVYGIYSVVDKDGPFKGLTRLSIKYVGTKKIQSVGPYKGMKAIAETK